LRDVACNKPQETTNQNVSVANSIRYEWYR